MLLLEFGILYTRINLPIYPNKIFNSQGIKINSRVGIQWITDFISILNLKGKLYKD